MRPSSAEPSTGVAAAGSWDAAANGSAARAKQAASCSGRIMWLSAILLAGRSLAVAGDRRRNHPHDARSGEYSLPYNRFSNARLRMRPARFAGGLAEAGWLAVTGHRDLWRITARRG